VGHSMLADEAAPVFPARHQFVPPELLQGFDERAPMRSRRGRGLLHFVENSGSRGIALQHTLRFSSCVLARFGSHAATLKTTSVSGARAITPSDATGIWRSSSRRDD